MTRLFGNIRKQLAIQNKVAAYMRYAVGEILLVVIGILIALQINNWNESRKQRFVEIKYLKNLKHDLLNDSIDLVGFIKIRSDVANAAHELLRYASSQKVDNPYKLDSLYISVALWYEFVPNNNTFNELISSGNLQLLKNDSIKNLLLDLNKENLDLVSTRDHMRREFDHYIYDQRNKIINFFEVNDPNKIHSIMDWYYPNRQSVSLNSGKVQDYYKSLFKNTIFINGLSLAAGNNLWIVDNHYGNMLDDISLLIKLINKEMKQDE